MREAESLLLDTVRRALDEGSFAAVLEQNAQVYARVLAVYESRARRRADQARSARRMLPGAISSAANIGVGVIAFQVLVAGLGVIV